MMASWMASAAVQSVVHLLQRHQIGVGGIARCLEGAAAFEQRNHGKDLVKVALGDLVDEAPAARLVAHQAFGGQHLERLAQRCARDGPFAAQHELVNEAARRQHTVENALAQLGGHFVVQGVEHQSHGWEFVRNHL